MQTPELQSGQFQRDFLAELEIAEMQLLGLAEAVPAENYGWKPAQDARSFSAVLVHIAAGNFYLLDRASMTAPATRDLYAGIEGDPGSRFAAVIEKNLELERTVKEKSAVIDLLKDSLAAVWESFAAATEETLVVTGNFFGASTTVRGVYMRMLAHSHQHMGLAIAYARMMGIRVPWPDPLKGLAGADCGEVEPRQGSARPRAGPSPVTICVHFGNAKFHARHAKAAEANRAAARHLLLGGSWTLWISKPREQTRQV